jgi:hypothetical protein
MYRADVENRCRMGAVNDYYLMVGSTPFLSGLHHTLRVTIVSKGQSERNLSIFLNLTSGVLLKYNEQVLKDPSSRCEKRSIYWTKSIMSSRIITLRERLKHSQEVVSDNHQFDSWYFIIRRRMRRCRHHLAQLPGILISLD